MITKKPSWTSEWNLVVLGWIVFKCLDFVPASVLGQQVEKKTQIGRQELPKLGYMSITGEKKNKGIVFKITIFHWIKLICGQQRLTLI